MNPLWLWIWGKISHLMHASKQGVPAAGIPVKIRGVFRTTGITAVLLISACSLVPPFGGENSGGLGDNAGTILRTCTNVDLQAREQFGDVLSPFKIEGSSMEPGLPPTSIVLVNTAAFQGSLPQRLNLIAYRTATETQNILVKRVIGLPQEKIQIAGGQVSVDERLLNEPYILEPVSYGGSWSLGAGEYFVLGDNRNNSSDSHTHGPVRVSQMIGLVICQFSP